jgi:hypothetical protein
MIIVCTDFYGHKHKPIIHQTKIQSEGQKLFQ